MARERDARNDMRDRLLATGAFTDVHLAGLPDTSGFGASELTAAAIEPANWIDRDLYDGGEGTGSIRTARLKITFLARHPDPQLCDEKCEGLLEFARNALNGKCLGDLSFPDKTKFGDGRWLPRTPPERRIEADFSFVYEIVGWDSNDTSD